MAEVVTVEAILADSATTAEGKLYVQGGGWNLLHATSLPFRVPRVGIVLLLSVPWTATNQMHRLEVTLRDQDERELPLADAPPGAVLGTQGTAGGRIHRFEAQFNVGRPPVLEVGDVQLIPIAINVDGLVFERAGSYHFVISVDGHEEKRLPLRVVLDLQPVARVG